MNNEQFLVACEKELKYIKKQEHKLQRQAMDSGWGVKKAVEMLIPQKVHVNLRAAFATAFTIIFEKGLDIIEKTYNKEGILKDFESRNIAIDKSSSVTVNQAATRRELKKFRSNVAKSKRWKSIITTAEGVGLGALGIGLPDIVLFIGFMLQSVYEVALKYGYDYDKPQERMLILKMMAASIQHRRKWVEADMEINEIINGYVEGLKTGKADSNTMEVPDFEDIQAQVATTADAFALDMLVLKFIQGLPVVGIIGGLSNPIYYSRIMEYVQLKYHKRYLMEKQLQLTTP